MELLKLALPRRATGPSYPPFHSPYFTALGLHLPPFGVPYSLDIGASDYHSIITAQAIDTSAVACGASATSN